VMMAITTSTSISVKARELRDWRCFWIGICRTPIPRGGTLEKCNQTKNSRTFLHRTNDDASREYTYVTHLAMKFQRRRMRLLSLFYQGDCKSALWCGLSSVRKSVRAARRKPAEFGDALHDRSTAGLRLAARISSGTPSRCADRSLRRVRSSRL